MDISAMIEKAERRVVTAREIADEFRDDERLHRLTMQSVFLLEDVLFALREMAERGGDMPGIDPKL